MESAFARAAYNISEIGFQDEQQREHEFYRYYDAVRSLNDSDTPWTDLFDDGAVKRHKPISSPDTALTAFCQLGALRCGTRRCLLFFFDQTYAYIVAEATRTLSLLDDHSHDVEDGLWLGHTIIPRGLSVCEHTVNIPSANKGSNQFHDNAAKIHIINDLTDDVRFCDRPYVLDGPKARFYAGVPITTPNGLRIGAYCVLGDKPRKGFSDKHVKFMLDMSETIMAHLESLRMRTEFGRGTRMLTGLGTFVKEAPDGRTGQSQPQKCSNIPTNAESSENGYSSATIDAADANDYFGNTTKPVVSSSPVAMTSNAIPRFSEDTNSMHGTISPSSSTRAQVCLEEDNEPDGGVGETFERAAALLRESVDADGVLFLDATVHSYGGAVTGRQCWSESEVEKEISSSTEADYASDETYEKTFHADCKILGSSRRGTSVGNDNSPGHGHPIPEKILKSLLRHYPQGAVWSFNSDGSMPSEEAQLASSTDTDDYTEPVSAIWTRRNRKLWDSRRIQAVFPGVRTICLVSMWDNVRERHYAGAIIWTYSPIRQFSSELSYMMAFCDVVMAKVGRLEASMKDQAKSDFISSVSHELRSPLHGILGSIDFLQEQAVLDWSMIAQIEKCSTTLMDVIDHLLDFAKLNHLDKKLKRISRNGDSYRTRAFSHATLGLGASASSEVVSLAKVTEEVADSIFFSHCCRMDEHPGKRIDLILDISMDPTLKCKIAVGAWKRLCINIIGNALKYTADGHVKVSLKVSPHKRRLPVAILTVSDTGIGISRDFLENRLFRAFSQENMLANGTGLGMSLVAKLVRRFNGKIKVQSAKGSGTTMTVSIPIDQQFEHNSQLLLPKNHGLTIGFLDLALDHDDAANRRRKLQTTAITGACYQLGTTVTEPKTSDVLFAFEVDLTAIVIHPEYSKLTAPIIVLCDNVMSAAHMRSSSTTKIREKRLEFIAQPFGPRQLATALEKCLTSGSKPALSGNESQSKATLSRETLKLQLSRRSHTDLAMRPPASVRPPLARAGSAPSLSWPLSSSLEPHRNPRIRSSETSASLDLAIPETPYLNGRARVFPDAFGHTETSHTIDEPIARIPSNSPEKLSLLLVDDNRINLRLLTTYADKNRHPRRTATNGLEAVQVYEAAATDSRVAKPVVIFLDINMPIMDGYEAARRIRAFEKAAGITNRCVIVAVTGLGSNSSQQMAYASGIDIFLSKPVRPRDLTEVLQALATAKNDDIPG